MSEYETLLKMIEDIDADEAELNAWFWCYSGNVRFGKTIRGGDSFTYSGYDGLKFGQSNCTPEYTKSLDALKAVRDEELEGCLIEFYTKESGLARCSITLLPSDGEDDRHHRFMSPNTKEEYRAIMHATAQAIEWKRENA